MTDSPLLQVRDLAITYQGGRSIIPGRRRSFEAVPWALCLAVALTALRARVLLIDDMAPAYPFGLGALAGTDPPWNG